MIEQPHTARRRGRRRTAAARPARALAAILVGVAVLAGCTAQASSSSSSAASVPANAPTADASPSPAQTLLPESTSSSAVGALAPGFPVDLLPVPPDADILVSAADPIPGSTDLQVSLNLRTSLTPEQILAMYRAPLTAAGFVEAPADKTNAALAAQATFTRSNGDEILVLGVLDRDGIRTLTLGGRVHASS